MQMLTKLLVHGGKIFISAFRYSYELFNQLTPSSGLIQDYSFGGLSFSTTKSFIDEYYSTMVSSPVKTSYFKPTIWVSFLMIGDERRIATSSRTLSSILGHIVSAIIYPAMQLTSH
jgi:hypothetical protein